MFSFPVMLGTFLVGRGYYSGRMFFLDPDVWWHIKTGQTILATHHFPTTDPYSFTVHGQPWVAYEWIGEVLVGWIARFGIRALDFYQIVVAGVILLSLYVLATMRSNSKAGFLTVGLLSPMALMSLTLRPQMLGYLCVIFTLIILEAFRKGRSWAIWILPPLFLIWVNMHGFWIIGLGIVVLYYVCGLAEFRIGRIEAARWTTKQREQISLAFLLSIIATAITPYGTEVAAFPFRYAFALPLNVAHIIEWQPMPLAEAGGKIFLGVVLGFFALEILFDVEWRLEELVLFLGGTALAFMHVRFMLLFVPFITPVLARIFARWLSPYSQAKDKFVLNGVLMACAVWGMIHYFPSRADLDAKVASQYPVKAVEYLRQHPVAGNMLNNYGFGGYLIYAATPQVKLFIDGRGDLYEIGGIMGDYLQLMSLKPGGLDVLRRYQIQSCLIRQDDALATVLGALPDWKKTYSDDLAVLYVRRASAGEWDSAARN
jgi:hypothetical protein